MKMLKKNSPPFKNYTFFREIYTPTIWTVYDRKRNARILGGILNHGVPTSGMQNVYWHFCRSKVDRNYATGVVKLKNEILHTVKH